MRASDAERDLTVDRLTTAFVEGRLDHGEYDRRVDLALGAVFWGELRALTRDLPYPPLPLRGTGAEPGDPRAGVPRPGPERVPRSPSAGPGSPSEGPSSPSEGPSSRPDGPREVSVLSVPWREWGEEWRWWLGVAVILTGVWGVVSLMDGELVPYWPLVPLGIWAAVLLASAIWPSDGEPP